MEYIWLDIQFVIQFVSVETLFDRKPECARSIPRNLNFDGADDNDDDADDDFILYQLNDEQ